MALKTRDIRGMNVEDRAKELDERRRELMHERGVASMGGAPANPGKIRDLRTTIARILTVQKEEGDKK
ncbi:MAG: 50S ribosomal protein L29 [Thermoplasmatota archaeon]